MALARDAGELAEQDFDSAAQELKSQFLLQQQQLQQTDADYVFTSARFSFPIQRALVMTASGGVAPFDPHSISKRSQDLPPAYHDAGQLYWGKASTWLD